MTTPKPYASPACYAHETDPEYAGYLGREEVLNLLADAHRLVTDRPTLRDAIETLIARHGGTVPNPPDDATPQDSTAADRLRGALPRIAADDIYRVVKEVLAGV